MHTSTTPTPSTVVWLQPMYGKAIAEFRACELCSQHVHVDGALHCADVTVAGAHGTKPVQAARARHGGCGPDAQHLHMAGLAP